jgi:hypothetical protein
MTWSRLLNVVLTLVAVILVSILLAWIASAFI